MEARSLGEYTIAELEQMGSAYEDLAEIAIMLAKRSGYSEEDVPEMTVKDIFVAEDDE